MFTIPFIIILIVIVCVTDDPNKKWLYIHTIFFPVLSVYIGMKFAGLLFDIFPGNESYQVLVILLLYLIGAFYLYIRGIINFSKPATNEKSH